MKPLVFLIAVAVAAHANPPTPPKRWATELEIAQIAYALELAEFPIKQRDLPSQLPLPPSMGLWGGKSARSPAGHEATVAALTDPSSDAGFYALRTVLKLPGRSLSAADLPDLEVTSVELLFICQPGIWLSVSGLSPHKERIEELRAQMQKEKLTPKAFIERWSIDHPLYHGQSKLTEKNSFRFEVRR